MVQVPDDDVNWQKKAVQKQKLYQHFLKKADKQKLLKKLPDLHQEAFSKID